MCNRTYFFSKILRIFFQVTAVNLDNQRLGKLANMEQLENLRWASFNNNDLTKIEVRYTVLKFKCDVEFVKK